MKLKQLLTKTLLVAAGLCVGGSAWADAGDEITNLNLFFNGSTSGNLTYVLGTGEVAGGNGTGQYWSPGVAVDSDNKRLKMANGNLTFGLANTNEFQNKDIVTISYDVALGYSTKDGNRDFVFQIKNSSGTAIVTETYNTRTDSRHSSSLGFTRNAMYNPGNADTDWANKVHFEITFNYATKKISATSSCATATNKTETIAARDMNDDQQVYIGSIYISSGNMNAMNHANLLANLKVITTKGDYSTTKTITYAYQDNNGTDITDLAISKGATASANPENGSTYTPEYPLSFIDDDYAYDYKYASGGDAFTVTNDKTITLTYTKSAHPTTSVTVQYKNGSDVYKEDVLEASYPVGKTKGYAVRKYVLNTASRTLYESASGSWRSVEAAEYIPENVTTTNINNVVFFSEGEELAGCTQASGVYSVASRQLLGRKLPMASLTTLGKGKYQLYAMFHVGNGSDTSADHKTIKFYAGSDEIGSKTVKQRSNNQNYTLDFSLSESKEIFVDCDDAGSSSGLDYVYIIKKAEIPTIGADGYATFSSDYALDFEHATGVNAYYSTSVSGNSAVMTKITGTAAAGEGLFLQKTESEISIPVVATGTTLTGNLLMATDGSNIPASTDGAYNYVFAKQDGELGFYKVATALSGVAAGKAYLHTTTALSGTGARLNFTFDNETTGINNVNVNHNDNCYDLQGRRVAQPQKGLYIVNGKKVLVK